MPGPTTNRCCRRSPPRTLSRWSRRTGSGCSRPGPRPTRAADSDLDSSFVALLLDALPGATSSHFHTGREATDAVDPGRGRGGAARPAGHGRADPRMGTSTAPHATRSRRTSTRSRAREWSTEAWRLDREPQDLQALPVKADKYGHEPPSRRQVRALGAPQGSCGAYARQLPELAGSVRTLRHRHGHRRFRLGSEPWTTDCCGRGRTDAVSSRDPSVGHSRREATTETPGYSTVQVPAERSSASTSPGPERLRASSSCSPIAAP